MAKLLKQNGTVVTDLGQIAQEMSALNIQLALWPVKDQHTARLLQKKTLVDEEKEAVLSGLDEYFLKLKQEAGYQSRDLIVLHDQLEGLDGLTAKFDRCHTHDDDEVRYIVDGEGVFGFIKPDGEQVELLVEAGEYINVPKDTEHWFYLTDKKRIKAVRYFTNTSGWAPVYTDTEQKVERIWQ